MNNRYDFIFLFDTKDANPNGDPDAGNLPRTDSETGHGLVTDVCLKRKVRNFVTTTKNLQPPYGIYVAEGAVLGRAHVEAFRKLGINLGEETRKELTQAVAEQIEEAGLTEGLRIEADDDDDEKHWLILDGTADKKAIAEWLKNAGQSAANEKLIKAVLKDAKGRKPNREETLNGKEQMCRDFYDVRTFGAVMSLKSAPNCGQVRGPVQLSFSRSIDPIVTSEHAITRMAVATEKESTAQSGDNRTMGRKFTIPYALYRTHGFINPFLADDTGFDDNDLELFFTALENAFQFDASAARPAGSMSPRALLVFRHDGTDSNTEQRAKQAKLGCAPSHKLFDRLKIKSFEKEPAPDGKPPREFGDYASKITFFNGTEDMLLDDFIAPPNGAPTEVDLGNGITLIRRI
jgi:CRISPR-associated protein Csd2